jgi:hypothetical protein
MRLLSPGLPVVLELAGSNPFGRAPVSLGDVVFDVAGPDAPHTPGTDLNSAKLPSLDEPPG